MRDCKIFQIYEGTSQIQRHIVSQVCVCVCVCVIQWCSYVCIANCLLLCCGLLSQPRLVSPPPFKIQLLVASLLWQAMVEMAKRGL